MKKLLFLQNLISPAETSMDDRPEKAEIVYCTKCYCIFTPFEILRSDCLKYQTRDSLGCMIFQKEPIIKSLLFLMMDTQTSEVPP